MNYRILSNGLHTSADIVYQYLKNDLGQSAIKIELPIDNKLDYVPTFHVSTRDFHILCVDVSENVYNPTRWHFISTCNWDCWPILFFVALPSLKYTNFSEELKLASNAGVGILEVNHRTSCCNQISPALSLSLCGLRKFNKSAFRKKYREVICRAEETFRNGEPNKACSKIYDEIEDLTRKIAISVAKKGDFRQAISNISDLSGRMSWSRVITQLKENVNRGHGTRYSNIQNSLLDRINGITPHRNQSGHKPRSRRAIIARDTQLRTRMESAVDLFLELINAIKGLRL